MNRTDSTRPQAGTFAPPPGAPLRTDTALIGFPWLKPPVTTRYRPRRLDLGGALRASLRRARFTQALLGVATVGFTASSIATTLGSVL